MLLWLQKTLHLYITDDIFLAFLPRRCYTSHKAMIVCRDVQFSGYEYELEAAAAAILAGQTECVQMPHKKILEIMGVMDLIYHKII